MCIDIKYLNRTKRVLGIVSMFCMIAMTATSCLYDAGKISAEEKTGKVPEDKSGQSNSLIKVGGEAPEFTLKDQDGNDVTLSNRTKGGLVLLAFYPKDDSPICTIEMKEFRDAHDKFGELGVQILGISTNSQKSHQNFKKKHELPFPLLSDESGNVSKSYGVYNKLMGVSQRSYFLIDENGDIQYEFVEKANINHRDNETLLDEARKVIENSD